jgi:hypothetical protein
VLFRSINEVAQDEIDDPVLPAERDRRLAPFTGERLKPFALPPRHYDAQNF